MDWTRSDRAWEETDLLNRSGGDKRIRNTGVIAEWRQLASQNRITWSNKDPSQLVENETGE